MTVSILWWKELEYFGDNTVIAEVAFVNNFNRPTGHRALRVALHMDATPPMERRKYRLKALDEVDVHNRKVCSAA